MLRKLWRVVPAALAVQGAGMIWLARYGALWQYNDLGWFQPLVLRPGMYVTGAAAVVYGAWHAWLAYTTPGRVLRAWTDDVAHDLHCGAVADLGWRVRQRVQHNASCADGCRVPRAAALSRRAVPGGKRSARLRRGWPGAGPAAPPGADRC
jgi:hypothetical protein